MPNFFSKSRTFWAEMILELKKASWPTFPQLRSSTWMVIVSVLVFGIFVALSDFSVYNWVTLVTRWIKGV